MKLNGFEQNSSSTVFFVRSATGTSLQLNSFTLERDLRSDACSVLFFRVLTLIGPTLSYSILSLYFSSMCPVKYRGTQICDKCKHSEVEWLIVVASTTIPAESSEQEELPCRTALSGKD